MPLEWGCGLNGFMAVANMTVPTSLGWLAPVTVLCWPLIGPMPSPDPGSDPGGTFLAFRVGADCMTGSLDVNKWWHHRWCSDITLVAQTWITWQLHSNDKWMACHPNGDVMLMVPCHLDAAPCRTGCVGVPMRSSLERAGPAFFIFARTGLAFGPYCMNVGELMHQLRSKPPDKMAQIQEEQSSRELLHVFWE